jgi:hypothetical protein
MAASPSRAHASAARATAPRTPAHAPTVIPAQHGRSAGTAQRAKAAAPTATTTLEPNPATPGSHRKAGLPQWALPILELAKAEILERCGMLHDPWRILQDWLRQIIEEAVNARVPPPVVWTADTGDRLFQWVCDFVFSF